MLDWLFGKKGKRPSTSPSPQAPAASGAKGSEDQAALLAALPVETRHVLAGLTTQLRTMTLTPPQAAEEELQERNVSRRRVWGDQAVDVPIQRGDAGIAQTALLRCLVADHRLANVTRVAVEEVPAAAPGETEHLERAKQQLADKSAADRAYYQKRLIKHMRKSGQTPIHSEGAIRKIVVTIYLQETFARHEILRVAEDQFYVMVCTKR